MSIFFVALGAMVGAIARHLIVYSGLLSAHEQYRKIFLINALGSALFGFFLAVIESKAQVSPHLRAFIFSGVLSSFTTFAAFSMDNFNLIAQGRFLIVGVNIGGQVLISLTLFFVAFRLGSLA